ncbi:MAG: hypothetical protein VB108_03740 [Anaerolineaceae bacterium]|nr:hypothetical protein [Anaerolineaceae bacterium]
MPSIDNDFALNMIGLGLVAFGLYIRFGNWKDWYWKTRGGMYGYIPLGLMMLAEANYKAVIPNAPRYVSISLMVALLLFALFLTLKQPKWIKPKWVNWIESQPKKVQQAMLVSAASDKNWSEHTASEAAIEAWVKELKKSHRS